MRPFRIGIGQLPQRILEIGSAETGSAEIGLAELGSREIGPAELGLAEIGSREIGSAEIGLAEIGSREIGFTGPLDFINPFLKAFDFVNLVLDEQRMRDAAYTNIGIIALRLNKQIADVQGKKDDVWVSHFYLTNLIVDRDVVLLREDKSAIDVNNTFIGQNKNIVDVVDNHQTHDYQDDEESDDKDDEQDGIGLPFQHADQSHQQQQRRYDKPDD